MPTLPPELLAGPFTLSRSRELGLTRRVLARHFVRLHHGVWVHRDHPMSDDARLRAARLALPDRAHLTGISLIQQLGLDYGPREPLRFVIQGDHHLALEGVFLHRTKLLPPLGPIGVTPAAAFIAYCARARVMDAIKVGDWLLNHDHMTTAEVRDLALHQLWRPGAHEAIWILEQLDGRSRSLPESEVRALLVFTGIEKPEPNLPIDEDGRVICDLVYRRWRMVVEHEGAQHQTDRDQYNLDLGRYAWMRRRDVGYVQSTHEKLRHPKTLVGEVYAELVSRGYDGSPPEFGERWRQLFRRVSEVLGPRDYPPWR
jgi:hypothetical protein